MNLDKDNFSRGQSATPLTYRFSDRIELCTFNYEQVHCPSDDAYFVQKLDQHQFIENKDGIIIGPQNYYSEDDIVENKKCFVVASKDDRVANLNEHICLA